MTDAFINRVAAFNWQRDAAFISFLGALVGPQGSSEAPSASVLAAQAVQLLGASRRCDLLVVATTLPSDPEFAEEVRARVERAPRETIFFNGSSCGFSALKHAWMRLRVEEARSVVIACADSNSGMSPEAYASIYGRGLPAGGSPSSLGWAMIVEDRIRGEQAFRLDWISLLADSAQAPASMATMIADVVRERGMKELSGNDLVLHASDSVKIDTWASFSVDADAHVQSASGEGSSLVLGGLTDVGARLEMSQGRRFVAIARDDGSTWIAHMTLCKQGSST
ncbi:hypothetical protein [Piscinibacter sp. HJYY11]|uniref:hypothetical protein n=1 Tax=Piscinibacter sp. HJYY11 TaxID=2801333 RepID=UPI00191CF861|nr:hypothetical protein [Piscinibacter sp. HJYY11]MBL0729585.1 hypothetical protein [Piscinibacter sp. HJYY11]